MRNETDNTCYKNVAAPKRAVDFETVVFHKLWHETHLGLIGASFTQSFKSTV